MASPRVLPPDVYDALELSALAFDGIGRGSYGGGLSLAPLRRGEALPCCIHGHAMLLEGFDGDADITRSLRWVGIEESVNDNALRDVVTALLGRVTFREWCKRLNVVRADTPTFDPANFPKKRRGAP